MGKTLDARSYAERLGVPPSTFARAVRYRVAQLEGTGVPERLRESPGLAGLVPRVAPPASAQTAGGRQMILWDAEEVDAHESKLADPPAPEPFQAADLAAVETWRLILAAEALLHNQWRIFTVAYGLDGDRPQGPDEVAAQGELDAEEVERVLREAEDRVRRSLTP